MPLATTIPDAGNPLVPTGPGGGLIATNSVAAYSNVTVPALPFSTGDIVGVVALMIGLFVVNLVGNICAIVAFCKDQKLQTVSNYYVFNLALSDLMLGVLSMPVFGVYMSFHFQWPFGRGFCKAWLVMDYMACVETILTIIMISHDRYLLVSQGLDYGKSQTYQRALVKIAISWVVSFLLFGPAIIMYDIWRGYSVVDSHFCAPEFHNVFTFNLVGTIVEFMLPLVLISCLNLGLYLSIRKRVRKRAHLMAMNMFQSKQSLVQASVSINSAASEAQSPQSPKENLEFPSPMKRAKSDMEKPDGSRTPKLRRSRSTNSLSNFSQRGESWRTRSIRKARSFRRSLRRPTRNKEEQDPVTIVITAYESREDVHPDTENDPYYGLRLSWSTSCLYTEEGLTDEEFKDPDSPRDELNFDPQKLRECWEESLGIKNTKYSRSTSDVPDSCSKPIDISKWFTPKAGGGDTTKTGDGDIPIMTDAVRVNISSAQDDTTDIILNIPVRQPPIKPQVTKPVQDALPAVQSPEPEKTETPEEPAKDEMHDKSEKPEITLKTDMKINDSKAIDFNCVDVIDQISETTPLTCNNHKPIILTEEKNSPKEKLSSSDSISKSPPLKNNTRAIFLFGEKETAPEKVPLLADTTPCETKETIMNSINAINSSNMGINESAEVLHDLPNVKNKKLPSSPLPTRASSLKVAGEKMSEMPPEVVIPSRPKLPASPLPVRAQSLKVPGERERLNGNNNVTSQPSSDSALKSSTATGNNQSMKDDNLKTRRSVSFCDLDEVDNQGKTPETSPNPSPTAKLKPACKVSASSIGSQTPDTPTKSVSFRDLDRTGSSNGSRRGSVISNGSPKRRSSLVKLGEFAMALRKGKLNHAIDSKKQADETKDKSLIDKETLNNLSNKLHKSLSLKVTSRSGNTTPTLRHSTSMISIPDSNNLLAVPIKRSRSLKGPSKSSSLKLCKSATSIEKVHLLDSDKGNEKEDRLTKSTSCLTTLCTESQTPTDSGSGSGSGSVQNQVPAPSPDLSGSKKSLDNKSFSSIASSPGSNRSAGSMGSYISNTSFTSLGLHTLKHFLQVNGENVQALTKILQRDRRAARSLLLLVVAFILCWAPFTVVTIMSSTCYTCVSQGWRTAACCLVWLNASLNPFLYAYTSHRFRAHFERMLCPCRPKHRTPAAFHSSLRTKDTQNM